MFFFFSEFTEPLGLVKFYDKLLKNSNKRHHKATYSCILKLLRDIHDSVGVLFNIHEFV